MGDPVAASEGPTFELVLGAGVGAPADAKTGRSASWAWRLSDDNNEPI